MATGFYVEISVYKIDENHRLMLDTKVSEIIQENAAVINAIDFGKLVKTTINAADLEAWRLENAENMCEPIPTETEEK